MFGYRVMQEPSQGVRPFIPVNDVVQPGEIANVLALLGGRDIFGSVAELAYKPIALVGGGMRITSTTRNEDFQDLP